LAYHSHTLIHVDNIAYKSSPDQHYISLFENDFTCIINTLGDVYKISGSLWLTTDVSIPTLTHLTCAINQLSPTIIDPEEIQLLNPYTNWAKNIIQSISIGSKSARNKNVRSCFKKFYCDKNVKSIILFHSDRFLVLEQMEQLDLPRN